MMTPSLRRMLRVLRGVAVEFGIETVVARVVEIILRDECMVIPVSAYRLGCLIPHDFARLLVFSKSQKDRLTKAVIAPPLSEFDLANHYRLNPVATSHLSGG